MYVQLSTSIRHGLRRQILPSASVWLNCTLLHLIQYCFELTDTVCPTVIKDTTSQLIDAGHLDSIITAALIKTQSTPIIASSPHIKAELN